jgi:hypothetical protein
MQGQFLYATCRGAGLRVNSIIRNTQRVLNSDTQQSDMCIELFIYQYGKQIYENKCYAIIKPGDFLVINEKDLPFSPNADYEGLIIVYCSRGDGGDTFLKSIN